jgi:hypothetical protein
MDSLPNDIMRCIAGMFSIPDLASLSSADRKRHTLWTDEAVWCQLIRRDFARSERGQIFEGDTPSALDYRKRCHVCYLDNVGHVVLPADEESSMISADKKHLYCYRHWSHRKALNTKDHRDGGVTTQFHNSRGQECLRQDQVAELTFMIHLEYQGKEGVDSENALRSYLRSDLRDRWLRIEPTYTNPFML